MTKDIIEGIITKIATDVPEFNEVNLWNNQIDALDAQEERPFAFPVCFIGFEQPFPYVSIANKTQKGVGQITVFVCDEIYQNTNEDGTPNLNILDLKTKVYLSLQSWSNKDICLGALDRIEEEADEDHPNVYVFKQRYSFEFFDASKFDNYWSDATPTSLDASGQLIIDNDIIRTSNEIPNG